MINSLQGVYCTIVGIARFKLLIVLTAEGRVVIAVWNFTYITFYIDANVVQRISQQALTAHISVTAKLRTFVPTAGKSHLFALGRLQLYGCNYRATGALLGRRG